MNQYAQFWIKEVFHECMFDNGENDLHIEVDNPERCRISSLFL